MRVSGGRRAALAGALLFVSSAAAAQSAADARLAIILAVARGATSPVDLRTLRTGTASGNSDTARLAYRSLGRLERPALVPDILPGLRHPLPEVRADAADALAQALTSPAAGPARATTPGAAESPRLASPLTTVRDALTARLTLEGDGMVRGVLRESLARLPYTRADDVAAAARTVREASRPTMEDRLGAARALETLVRTHASLWTPDPDTLDALTTLAAGPLAGDSRDARVRRVAADALILAHGVDATLATRLLADSDAQVRQRAMRAVASARLGDALLRRGLADPSPGVRLEALRGLALTGSDALCSAALGAAHDPDLTTALVAVDLLARCAGSPDAVTYLESAVADLSDISVPRGWHRGAHALVALASAAPDRVGARLADYAHSTLWPVRRYAAHAAAILDHRDMLDALATDPEPVVANTARGALGLPRLPDVTPRKDETIAISANDLRRLAAPRARITVRDVGRVEIALLTTEAPLTVLRFVELARSGFYNGAAFDAVSANAVAQAAERPDRRASYPRVETSRWPHVRGTVALSSRDGSDARFFINLSDAPAFDHEYAVFAQVLNGSDVVDRILEGDIIDDIEILP